MAKDSWEVYCEFVSGLERYGDKLVQGSQASLEDWRKVLPEADFDLLVFSAMDSLRLNCGSFSDAVANYRGFRIEIDRALRRFGFQAAADIVDDAIALDMQFQVHGPTFVFSEGRERIDASVSISYQRLLIHLTEHHNDFSLDIRPMIEREGGLKAVLRRPTLSISDREGMDDLPNE